MLPSCTHNDEESNAELQSLWTKCRGAESICGLHFPPWAESHHTINSDRLYYQIASIHRGPSVCQQSFLNMQSERNRRWREGVGAHKESANRAAPKVIRSWVQSFLGFDMRWLSLPILLSCWPASDPVHHCMLRHLHINIPQYKFKHHMTMIRSIHRFANLTLIRFLPRYVITPSLATSYDPTTSVIPK